MSAMYIRVQKDTHPSKMYGFQKLHWDDIKMITSRMQEHTFNSRLGINEMAQYRANQGKSSFSSPSPVPCQRQRKVKHRHDGPRGDNDCWQGYQQNCDSDHEDNDSYIHSDQTMHQSYHTSPSGSFFVTRKVAKKNLDRIVNRLYKTQTLSSALAASGVGYYCDVTNMDPVSKYAMTRPRPRPKSAPVLIAPTGDTAVQRLQRPTTANRRKQVGAGQFWNVDKTEKFVLERDYSDDKFFFESELEEVVERIRAPTHASEGGIPRCKKSALTASDLKLAKPECEPKPFECRPKKKHKIQEEPLPLISGLRRSANVTEIVNRLYTPKKKLTTTCTPINYPIVR